MAARQPIGEFAANCLQGESAFCTAICPFHLDVRDFMEKMTRGAFGTAFKAYRNAVGFPRIVSALCAQPCRTVCPREQSDAAPDMRLLEKAAIAYAGNTAPNRYSMPAKKERIAIVGAGPCGLACALRLASRRYDVTVYERSERIGGHLWDILPAEIILPDLEEQFRFETYTLNLNQAVANLDELSGFDAVFLAVGADGDAFGLRPSPDGAFASDRPGFFLAGSMTGVDSVQAIADGLHAVHAIERFLKTGAMNHPHDNTETQMKLDPSAVIPAAPVSATGGGVFTKEEASAEAARCLRCSCDACIRHCDLMAYYRKYPERIRDEVAITIDPASLDGEETFAKKLMATCNQCGMCADACPQKIDTGAFLLDSRRAMHKKGKLPWAFHDFWLRDMAHAMGEEASLIWERSGALPRGATGYGAAPHQSWDRTSVPLSRSGTSPRVFFPGCQLGASDPAYVTESYRWLTDAMPDTALWLSCCGAPALWSGDEELNGETRATLRHQWASLGKPELIFACPSCKQMFAEFLPEAGSVFLFELMQRKAFVAKRNLSGSTFSLFDPCSSRLEPALQSSVRALVRDAGARLEPLAEEGEWAKCCSWGGHVSIANPDYARTVVSKRIGQSELPYITYCVNCRDIFAGAGKESLHLLDVLFDLNSSARTPPGFSERRENRARLRQLVTGEDVQEKQSMIIHINETLRRKLAADMLLEEDARRAVERCESEGRSLTDKPCGNRRGYAVIGRITCWVEYKKLANGEYQLINAYAHRMAIELEETWHGQRTKADL